MIIVKLYVTDCNEKTGSVFLKNKNFILTEIVGKATHCSSMAIQNNETKNKENPFYLWVPVDVLYGLWMLMQVRFIDTVSRIIDGNSSVTKSNEALSSINLKDIVGFRPSYAKKSIKVLYSEQKFFLRVKKLVSVLWGLKSYKYCVKMRLLKCS